MDFYATNHPDTEPTAMAAILEFLQTTPYTGWCRLLSELVDIESLDTPEDRQLLRNSVVNLLYNDAHVGQCILNTTVALCVQRGELILPPHLEASSLQCTAYDSLSSQLAQSFGPHSSSWYVCTLPTQGWRLTWSPFIL